MKIALYLDEDSEDQHLIRALRARGVDVVAAWEVGMRERDDEEHLITATAQGRTLYSFNAGDFYRIHTSFLGSGPNSRTR